MSLKTSSSADEASVGLGQPDCPHCGGLGYFMPAVAPDHPSFGRAIDCGCRTRDKKDAQFNRLLKLSEIGELQHCTFGSFTFEVIHIPGFTSLSEQSLREAFKAALEFAEDPEGWLVLKGGYGCGKTHLAAAIANYRLSLGKPVLFINTPDLLDYLRASYRPDAVVGYEERFEQVRSAAMLILDDLGTQNNTAWAQEKLYQIINYRYTARLPTVITTNQELEAIEPRIRSRLVDFQLVKFLRIDAPDFRRPREEQYDLSTLTLHKDKRFDAFDLRENELPPREANNLKRIAEAAIEYAQNPQGWIVFNSVGYGNGKTHLAAAIANHRAAHGEQVLFVVVPDLLDYLRAAFNPASTMGLDKRFDEVKKAPLLVLDDLGTESATAWAREKLYQLFNYRYSARLPTVITSAVPIEQLDERLKSRMMDDRVSSFWVLEAPSYYLGKGSARRKRSRRRG